MIQQLASISIPFDDLKLAHTSSAFRHGIPIRPWGEGRTFLSRLQQYVLGDTIKKPWVAVSPDDSSSAVQIHRGARLRALGLKAPIRPFQATGYQKTTRATVAGPQTRQGR